MSSPVTVREAAELLHCSASLIQKRCRREPDAPQRVGVSETGAALYDLDELEAFILRDRLGDRYTPRTATIAGDYIECLECGAKLLMLGRHLGKHDMTADEYREKHRLPYTAPLSSMHVRAAFADAVTADGRSELISHDRQAELQAAGVPHLRDSRRNRHQTEAWNAARAVAVEAMRARRREILLEKLRAAGYDSIEDALAGTAHLSGAAAARALGVGSSSVLRWRAASAAGDAKRA